MRHLPAGKFGKSRTAALFAPRGTTTGIALSERVWISRAKHWRFAMAAGKRREPLFDESIAEADDGLDLAASDPELATEPADVHVDRSRFNHAVVAPDPLQQTIA